MKNKAPLVFLILSIVALLFGMSFGLLAALQYVLPDFLKEWIPFNKMRPFHVTTVLSWIILSATGSIYFFMANIEKLKLYSNRLMEAHLVLFVLTGIGIYIAYATGEMQGREYLAFTPFLTIPILIGWLLFGINYFKTLINKVKNWPVYYWMWATGITFMIYHLCEAHFWMIPNLRELPIKDMMVQWKSYGSFTGSWNMLVYGISIYVMSKIKNDPAVGRGKLAFFFYFLGLTNLMFGWAHHTYILPTIPWIRYVAYAISMTEWVVLGYMIYSWKKSLPQPIIESFKLSYKFLMATDFWIFLNLILALLFSIPSINYLTHGTHVTVAHSMGTTIGINTTILFSALLFIVSKLKFNTGLLQPIMGIGFKLFNGSLFLFFSTLLYAGYKRSEWMYNDSPEAFGQMQDALMPTYLVFFVCGVALFVAIFMICLPLLKQLIRNVKSF